ncbi:methionine--tRNA ligase [Candidatus Saganbacteria bacterium CG08_land_8_20_14_0_20_45_16]|uniref:Methionine--tRNA ligase n=1 Tax=Candidatus Saganbacteria bacterium CG08_land_8_20_14_0_20_45_16 TaxID=2014293 RepID=A0A2H0Y1L0_UNCSA|nr:MAG: methionine--tRNA ligase [Candidatus Saganbacteria bacterium CG08_land_8_20_14_0_20_45_16]
MAEKFYLTTPIYYVNDVPHIGHAYTTIAADVLARYKRMMGFDVYFLTGTDEHGEKIWNAAGKNLDDTKKLVEEKVAGFISAWKILDISNDDFIRTTEKRHEEVVQKVFHKLLENGDVYLGEYEGWYCVPCESFWSLSELKEDPEGRKLCPDCGRETEVLKEESYFFKLSKYQDQLLAHIKANPDFIQPESRRNEILKFIEQGLRDLSITRTAFPWGIGVPDNPKHVIYVWFDALINYISALGWPDGEKFKKYWPADVHIMGKEIVRFHAVTWLCMLMALGVPLPKKVFGHGWWTVGGKKMSKSKGNVVDPLALSKEFGLDAVRYFLLREVPFGVDGDFSRNSFIKRYNSDLANDLGNLLNRTLNMVERYFNGVIPDPKNLLCFDEYSQRLVEGKKGIIKAQERDFEELSFSLILIGIWSYITLANVYIENQAPWKLAKFGETDKLGAIMYHLCFALSAIAYFVAPFMPETSQKIWQQLGLTGSPSENVDIIGVKVAKGDPLFPRIEVS